MVKKKPSLTYLDVTKPNASGNFYLINSKNEIIGEVPQKDYMKKPENYMNDEIMPITYTGYRTKRKAKPKTKRCKCK